MEAVVEQLPQAGHLQVTIQASADINYSAKAARRIAGRFVADEVGYLLRSDDPNLVVAERIYWRVPIVLALPSCGAVGTVGTLDVDVETGQLLVTPEQVVEITRHAENLAANHSATASPAS